MEDIPIVLVGNKVDLNIRRKVDKCTGKAYARNQNMLFLETSAKTAAGVSEAFSTVVCQIQQSKKNQIKEDRVVVPKRACCQVL